MKNSKTKSHTERLGIATTMAAAASKTGLPLSVIKSAQDAGCKAFKANGRVDCDMLVEFVATMPKLSNAADYQVERALEKRAVRMLKEQEYQKRSGELRAIGDIRKTWFRNTIACKSKLYSAENTIVVDAGMKLGLNANQIAALREIIQKHQRPAIKELFEGDLGKVECPECKKEIRE